MKKELTKNQSHRVATRVENADDNNSIIIPPTPPTTNNGIAEGGEEKRKADLRLIPKKYRPALYAKKAEMELGVINNFGNALSQKIVTVTGIANAVAVEENAIISSAIVGKIVLKKSGKGLDLRYLSETFKITLTSMGRLYS